MSVLIAEGTREQMTDCEMSITNSDWQFSIIFLFNLLQRNISHYRGYHYNINA